MIIKVKNTGKYDRIRSSHVFPGKETKKVRIRDASLAEIKACSDLEILEAYSDADVANEEQEKSTQEEDNVQKQKQEEQDNVEEDEEDEEVINLQELEENELRNLAEYNDISHYWTKSVETLIEDLSELDKVEPIPE